MAIQFKKASRQATKLKIAIDGPSGSGKTEGALALGHGITNGGKIAVADSENGSASLYADRYTFDTVILQDADPATLEKIIDAAVEGEYDVLVIDSLSHVWQAVLDAKDDHERANPRSNSYANWRVFGQRWERLVKKILDAPIHIIATMRSKQAYEQTESNGKKQVVKLGLQPMVRDGAEYEFSLVFSVNISHRAQATKDRTGMFDSEFVDLRSKSLHANLVNWMNQGGPAPVVPVQMPVADEDRRAGGKRLGDYSTVELNEFVAKHKDDKTYALMLKAARNIVAKRALGTDDDSQVRDMMAGVVKDGETLPFPE